MTRAKRTAFRLRALILLTGILYTAAALCWMLLPLFPQINEPLMGDDFTGAGLMGVPVPVLPLRNSVSAYAFHVALGAGLLLLAQWAFLRPGRAWTARLSSDGRPLRSSVIAAGAMAMLLTFGAITLLFELAGSWEPIVNSDSSWWPWAGLWTAMAILWGVWTWIFFVYWRQGDRYTQLGRMIRALVAGSLVESAVAVPVHIVIVRQRDCYCELGTYTTLVFAGTVLLWAFGPCVVLLYMRERYRRARLFPLCTECGYNLTGNTSGVCPECGTPKIPR